MGEYHLPSSSLDDLTGWAGSAEVDRTVVAFGCCGSGAFLSFSFFALQLDQGDGCSDSYRVAFGKQKFENLSGYRRGNFRTDFGCAHLKKDIVLLNGVAYFDGPGDNRPFRNAFAQFGHFYFKCRHIILNVYFMF